MRASLLIILFLFLLPIGASAQSGKLGDIYNRLWFIIAMKCPDEDMSRVNQSDEFASYYFTLRWEPTNLNSAEQGRFEKVWRDIIEGQREEGHYVLTARSLNEGRLVLDTGHGTKKEYIIRMADQNHLTLTLVTNDPTERCRVFYAVAK